MFGIKRKKAVQPEPIPQPVQSRPVIRTVPQMTTLANANQLGCTMGSYRPYGALYHDG